MPFDINSCRFSGKLQGLKQIQTRTGTPMVSFFLQCWKEQIKIVCFKALAEQVLNTLHDGDRAEITGRLQSSSWEYEGIKRYGFQIIADEIRADTDNQGQVTGQPVRSQPRRKQQVMNDRDPGQFDYSGGPF